MMKQNDSFNQQPQQMAAEMWKDVPKSIPTAAYIGTCFRKPVPKKRKTWMNGQKHGKAYRNLRNSHSPHGKPDVESCVSPWKLRPRASCTGVSCAPEIHGCRKIRSFHSAAICQRLFLFWVVQKKRPQRAEGKDCNHLLPPWRRRSKVQRCFKKDAAFPLFLCQDRPAFCLATEE
ncbi:MAG: hypothetical protein K6T49_05015, partial [Acidobacterium ailaaui]|nr:hypothetical protein [Pseudacidobacterium ailaaui]